MNPKPLTPEERKSLLQLARASIEAAVDHRALPVLPESELTEALRTKGASFVTLTIGGNLRGCIGALEAYQPLADDVQEHAIAAALEDYRFPPVTAEEIPLISIEISRLTSPVPLPYKKPEELPGLLKPHVDGVILKDGFHRATFLPQVWQQLPEPPIFLSHLCQKMGAAPDLWKRKVLEVSIYHVEEFSESPK